MALWSRKKEGGVALAPRAITIQELMNYQILDKDGAAIIVAEPPASVKPDAVMPSERGMQLASQSSGIPREQVDFRELGTTGTTSWRYFLREEYNPDLRGSLGLMMYDKMRRSDSAVRSSLRLAKTPILAAHWYVDPATNSKQDKKVAELVSNNLFKWMSSSWPQMLAEILAMFDFGYYMLEKVWTVRNGKTVWQKWAPRHPLDLAYWDFDSNGGPRAAWFYDPGNMGGDIEIPIKKLLVFSFDKEAGMMEGISLLRSAYKHWYFKDNLYKIDAIQKERHGIGVPVIKLPANFNPTDRLLADEIGRNLRTNEKAHIVLPPNWEILMLKMEGQPVDIMKSIEHHNKQIFDNVLAPWMGFERGSAIDDYLDIYNKANRYVADIVRDVINKHAIPELVNHNWKTVEDYPELKARRIGDVVDWRTISFALRNLIGAGVIIPDTPLEEWARDEMDLPLIDEATQRIVQRPQAPEAQIPDKTTETPPGQQPPGSPQPPRVGPPRQTPTPAIGTGKGSTGTDKSGGK